MRILLEINRDEMQWKTQLSQLAISFELNNTFDVIIIHRRSQLRYSIILLIEYTPGN